jgi:hypothetical protein
MSEWMMPLLFGVVFYVLATLRSRVIAVGCPPNALSRALRAYGTIWTVGEGYLMLSIRSLLEGTTMYGKIAIFVIAASLVWLVILGVIALLRNKGNHASGTF